MINHIFLLLLYLISECNSDKADGATRNHLKIIQAGDGVNLTCIFSKVSRANLVWVKQRVGEKLLPLASLFQGLTVTVEKNFEEQNRIFVTNDESRFNLSITNAEASDTATYYCVKHAYTFIFEEGTDLIVQDGDLSMSSELPETCAVLSQSCAGDHNVYWVTHQSGESTCAQILLKNTTREELTDKCFETHWILALLIIAVLSVVVNIAMGAQLYRHQRKDGIHNTQNLQLMGDDADALNYAALSFQQKPFNSRRVRDRNLQDNSVYRQVQYQ